MNELDFRSWLRDNGINKKMQSDYSSRLKRIERTLHIDLDEQYALDKCASLLLVFKNKGQNPEMEKYAPSELPIGKFYMSAYKLAVVKYVEFLTAVSKDL